MLVHGFHLSSGSKSMTKIKPFLQFCLKNYILSRQKWVRFPKVHPVSQKDNNLPMNQFIDQLWLKLHALQHQRREVSNFRRKADLIQLCRGRIKRVDQKQTEIFLVLSLKILEIWAILMLQVRLENKVQYFFLKKRKIKFYKKI